MSEPKFTPGPWHVGQPHNAAAEMYEALEKIADINPYTATSEVAYELIDIARAALRKARGESEVKK